MAGRLELFLSVLVDDRIVQLQIGQSVPIDDPFFFFPDTMQVLSGDFDEDGVRDVIVPNQLSDRVRYRLRRRVEGPGVMKWGIDFNQFTYPQMRREFRRIGFSGIHDRLAVAAASPIRTMFP